MWESRLEVLRHPASEDTRQCALTGTFPRECGSLPNEPLSLRVQYVLRVLHVIVHSLTISWGNAAKSCLCLVMSQGIRHPGFAFVEILSPCVTFRPEQREWKNVVHAAGVGPTDDPARAARRIMSDDGFNIGVLYAGNRTPYPYRGGHASASVADLEQVFQL